jgi:ABC-type Mn2+/Zn2+ transport system permease subunit
MLEQLGTLPKEFYVYGGLFLFGILYNLVVGYLEKTGRAEGYTSALVIIHILVSVGIASLLVGQHAAALVMWCHVASGAPLTIGSFWRQSGKNIRNKAALRESAKKEASRGNTA